MNVKEFQEKCRKLGLPEKDIKELTEKALKAKAITEDGGKQYGLGSQNT